MILNRLTSFPLSAFRCLGGIFFLALSSTLSTLSRSNVSIAASIVDYQRHLNPRFPKRVREETRFIILHSTESRLPSALRTLSRGKVRRGRYVTRGGHAHYLISRDGVIYRILDAKYWANHAGVSMWNGLEDLSNYSVGIELEGFHNVPFEEEQYRSLQWLLEILKKRFRIEDHDVLEHYRVAYSHPNHYHRNKRRGRKSDPGMDNFDRLRAGLRDQYPEDPDVVAGRLGGTPPMMLAEGQSAASAEQQEEDEGSMEVTAGPNIISSTQTAWKIAGTKYQAPTTLYKFPDGTFHRGDQIENWSNIPAGTEVKLEVTETEKKVVTPLKAEVVAPEVSSLTSPWKIANALYNSSFTFYVYPDGSLHPGNTISVWPSVPLGSKVLIAYRKISRPRTTNRLGEDLEDIYLDARTLYLFPDRALKSGDQIDDFTKVPAGTLVFRKLE